MFSNIIETESELLVYRLLVCMVRKMITVSDAMEGFQKCWWAQGESVRNWHLPHYCLAVDVGVDCVGLWMTAVNYRLLNCWSRVPRGLRKFLTFWCESKARVVALICEVILDGCGQKVPRGRYTLAAAL